MQFPTQSSSLPARPVHDAAWHAKLLAIVGPAGVAVGDAIPAQACHDWSGLPPVRPGLRVSPASTSEVSAVMAACHAAGVPVVPQGGLSGLAGGAVPLADGVALSLRRMNRSIDIDPLASVLTADAGVSLQQAQEAAEAAGLQVGLDLGARGSCQLGGTVATNAGGNGVVQFGMMREQVLGLEVVLADGRVLDMLRPMVKNNTGYDLKQWFIGSEGTLGVITRVQLRLHPRPRARATALVALASFEAAMQLLARLRADFPGALAAFELMWRDFMTWATQARGLPAPLADAVPYAALVDVTGPEASLLQAQLEQTLSVALDSGGALDAVLAQSRAQAAQLWHLRESSAEIPVQMRPVNFDVSVPLAVMGAFADECVRVLEARWPGQRCVRFGHLGDGNLHLSVDLDSLPSSAAVEPDDVEGLIYDCVGRFGGSVSAEHGIGMHKKPYLGVSRSADEIDAMRALKHALDPRGILNPGRLFDL